MANKALRATQQQIQGLHRQINGNNKVKKLSLNQQVELLKKAAEITAQSRARAT